MDPASQGKGHTVKDVLAQIERVAGHKPSLIVDVEKAQADFEDIGAKPKGK
ncbi:MAG: hypothetical protein ACYTGW_10060 [Planctomycetota bacterium]|jgi:hypothetical protein